MKPRSLYLQTSKETKIFIPRDYEAISAIFQPENGMIFSLFIFFFEIFVCFFFRKTGRPPPQGGFFVFSSLTVLCGRKFIFSSLTVLCGRKFIFFLPDCLMREEVYFFPSLTVLCGRKFIFFLPDCFMREEVYFFPP